MRFTKKIILSILVLVMILGCNASVTIQSNDNDGEVVLTKLEQSFLDSLQYRTFLFFWYEANPLNGLVKDRSTKDSPASIAATGFAIPAWAIGAEKKWVTREQTAERT